MINNFLNPQTTLNKKHITMLRAVVPLLIALLSSLVISRFAASENFHLNTIKQLDQKKTTVLELTAGSAAASAALSAIPGDATTPIADKLADLSTYFLIVICAIYLEKYLVTITGYAAFTFLIPIACVMFSANVFLNKDKIHTCAIKLIVFSLAFATLIPLSVKVSHLIENTYAASIEETISEAKQESLKLENMVESSPSEDETATEEEGFLKDVKNTISNGVAAIGDGISAIGGGITDLVKKFETQFTNFLEAFAVLLVTSCLIPIIVLLCFLRILKTILGADIKIPQLQLKNRLKLHTKNNLK